jgi:iron complex transport system ATP-binding protein
MREILKITELIAGYGDKKILENINLCIKENSFIGIIGPNGSGKSTFLQVLARSLSPDSGVILLKDQNLMSYPFRQFGQEIGFIPQENEIPFAYPVYDIVMMGRNPHIPRFRQPSEKDHEIVKHALELTGTGDLAEREITSLSGGERQRVLIARVLAQDSDILLLDEPFAHLDLHHQHELFRLMRDATRGNKTVIGIFHDINLAATYCDHLIVLYEGKVFATGTPEEILQENLLKEIFKIQPVIRDNPISGTPYIYVSEKNVSTSSTLPEVHIISGGGFGSSLISRLNSLGCRITCGILSENDSDYQIAERLGLGIIYEPPFTEISKRSEELLQERLKFADWIIMTGMPVGRGNYANIQALEKVSPEKIIIFSPDINAGIQDYTGGKATELISSLKEKGTVFIEDIKEIEYLLLKK